MQQDASDAEAAEPCISVAAGSQVHPLPYNSRSETDTTGSPDALENYLQCICRRSKCPEPEKTTDFSS